MFYCENCGIELREGIQFCEECGSPVSNYILSENIQCGGLLHNLFERTDWEKSWRTVVSDGHKEGSSIGIILINTHDCPDLNNITTALNEFITAKWKQGVRYYCLDLNTEIVCRINGDSNIDSILPVLHAIYKIAVPDYLMIIGNTESISGKQWENHADEFDEYVCSDLPYLTMDLISPWDGRKYDFDRTVLTGRIPSCARNGFSEACSYLKNYVNFEHPTELIPFGLSAFQWKGVSEEIYRQLGSQLLLSPEIEVDYFNQVGIATINGGKEPNLLYFNLHGSDHENYWYGERDSHKPRAFASTGLPKKNGYVIGVEACYGANQFDENKQPKSILLEAIQNGCLAFVGSDTIAYGGARRGQVFCADVMISRFLFGIKEGKSVGQAFLDAKKELWSSKHKDDALIKTCAQFALYGDPSATLVRKKQHIVGNYSAYRNICVPIPDIGTAVRISQVKVNVQIETRLNQYIGRNYTSFHGIQPKYYKVHGTQLTQAMYTKREENMVQVLKLYYDQNGNIEREYLSR